MRRGAQRLNRRRDRRVNSGPTWELRAYGTSGYRDKRVDGQVGVWTSGCMGHVDIQDKCSHGTSRYVGEVGIGSVFVEWGYTGRVGIGSFFSSGHMKQVGIGSVFWSSGVYGSSGYRVFFVLSPRAAVSRARMSPTTRRRSRSVGEMLTRSSAAAARRAAESAGVGTCREDTERRAVARLVLFCVLFCRGGAAATVKEGLMRAAVGRWV